MRNRRLILVTVLLWACIIPARAGRHDRGVVSMDGSRTPFMKEGSWAIGGSASGSTYGIDGYGLSFIQVLGGDGYRISVKPGVMYAFRNDLAVGITGIYTRTLMDMESAGVEFGQVSLNVNDYYSLGHNIGGAVILRKYLPIGGTGRFALYVDGSFLMTFGQSQISNREGEFIKGTYQNSRKIGLSVNPGMTVHLTPHVMLSAGIGIAGVAYSWAAQVHNQVATGTRNGLSASYMLNPAELTLGVHYNF